MQQNIARLRQQTAEMKRPSPTFLGDENDEFITGKIGGYAGAPQMQQTGAESTGPDPAKLAPQSAQQPATESDFIPEQLATTSSSGASPAASGEESTQATPTQGPTAATENGAAPTDGEFYNGEPTAGGSGSQGNYGTADFGPPNPAADPNAAGTAGTQGNWSGPSGHGLPPPNGGGPGGAAGGDLRIREEEGSPWGGNKPEFLGNMPRNGPQATEWEVTGDQLVENRMASLMESDNPVFQSLREATMRAHAARGGKNSLMASRAAVTMMADMAFKIGSQDAATLARSAEFNAAMKNQFGLAEQRFFHNALLSDQNYRQGVMVIREQTAGRIAEIGAESAGRVAAINAQVSGELTLEDRRTDNQIRMMDRAHGQNLERDELGFQHNWALNEQGQGHTLERMDRQADNNMRENDNQFRNQFTLTYLSESSATQRAIIAATGEVRGNPNLKPEQAAAGVRDILSMYNAFNEQNRAFFGNPRPGANGPTGNPEEDGKAYGSPAYDYTSYAGSRGISMGQGGYRMYAPPTMRFWGGSGTNGPMYGSNTAYARGTRPHNPRPSGSSGSGNAPRPGPGVSTGPSGGNAPPPTGGGGGGPPRDVGDLQKRSTGGP